MNIDELVKRVERGEKWRLGSEDIAMLNTMNTSKVKRRPLRTWLSNNWIEIVCIIIMVVCIVGGMVLWAESLPDPVTP